MQENNAASTTARPSEGSRRSMLLAAILLALLTLAVDWPVTGHGFLDYDDQAYVTDNPVVLQGLSWPGVAWAFTTGEMGSWHPLTWLSHMLDCEWFGQRAEAHHLVSLVIHVVNAMLLLVVLARMTGAWRPSFLVAALFALHPLHVESVAWIAERKNVLSTFFLFLTLWAYERHVTKRGGRWYPAVILFFALGLMAKPMLVTVPFLLLLLDYWPLQRFGRSPGGARSAIPLVVEKLPLFLLTLGSCIVTLHFQRQEGALASLASLPLARRLANALMAYVGYLGKLIFPVDLAVIYLSPASWPAGWVGGAAVALALASFFAVRHARRQPHLFTGWFWFLGTAVPIIGLVQVGNQFMADRYAYIPLIGLYIAIAWSAAALIASRPWLAPAILGLVAAALIGCAWLSMRQVADWRDKVSLFTRAVAVTRDNAVARVNLGEALLEQGEAAKAEPHLREAVRLLPLGDAQDNTRINLGVALVSLGRVEEGIREYGEVLKTSPDNAAAHMNLALALQSQGQIEPSLVHYQAALRLDPANANGHAAFAYLLTTLRRPAKALEHYREALRLDPDAISTLNNLAYLLATDPSAELRDGAEAVRLAERANALAAQPEPVTMGTLAAAYAEAGRFEDAVRTADAAEELARERGQPELADLSRTHLQLYRERKPLRDPAS
ncbi:MAG: tetratricopeptide repeat protein [Candidatus Limnocylindria bacterium]|jgi:tetratricopeptide (TPR) repeat protein